MSFMRNILSKSAVGALAVGAAMFVFAGDSAEAATIQMNTGVGLSGSGANVDGPFNVTLPNIYRFENDDFAGADAGGAFFGFEFTADDLPQPVNATVTLNLLGEFTNFEAVWSDDNVIDAGDTALIVDPVGTLGVVDQNVLFTSVPQWLLVSYDSVANDGVFDLRVSAVPLPAGGLLLLTALGGVAALRRKRKAA
ncbi:VPLPA-CTERM sorting domain-containing protein [Roseovarius spongiae]|uniref:VPLPA-CTERM sorting domain-containing protein n=1 Tax=Roseovarius spongiae TaxID=2320272 RepID=A0A3A8B790_9RHOB|nr:VPLPA-CTERM sorting domain-containing protein [Roseovarius spongiae]RKF12391.1 VPLPA-CTERM sorting domain-containing protein [Roseovarius spongiae]